MVTLMIDEPNKYRAQLFQITGLSFFAPIGKIFIDIKELRIDDLNLAFLIHLIVSLYLGYFGMILISKGYEVLKEGK